ncbi:Predicted nucleic acid-binding protein, contains PIN domain [Lentzea waywayandensis]|uniref:Predicted nucleic acid-binding protein, contains PIN domain n=1 Tax=Lentzea waywayandensis TaxID=84724 RepID=A0A1I6EKI8_9PSEU|nr:PIN domain-containing protein [Lentzea waywayandensis]SFR17992.1 Predicted nucleic acid-binding protein, contains PIN domain [Lentzea waywayandensis]
MLPVFIDTCVLLKPYLCDTLLTISESGVYRPLWSRDVMAELDRNLRKRGASEQQVAHRLEQMQQHFPDAEVTGYQHLVESMDNDPKDRHVLAAAVWGGAELLVTENLKDFPDAAVKRFGIEVLHQDEFLLDQLDLAPELVIAALRRQVSRYRRAPRSVDELLDVLANEGHRCTGFTEAFRGARSFGTWRS